MPISITKLDLSGEINCKRLYLPFLVKDHCPSCEKEWVWSAAEGRYLSYPTPGQEEDLMGYCEDCGTEWEVLVVFDVTLTPVEPK